MKRLGKTKSKFLFFSVRNNYSMFYCHTNNFFFHFQVLMLVLQAKKDHDFIMKSVKFFTSLVS